MDLPTTYIVVFDLVLFSAKIMRVYPHRIPINFRSVGTGIQGTAMTKGPLAPQCDVFSVRHGCVNVNLLRVTVMDLRRCCRCGRRRAIGGPFRSSSTIEINAGCLAVAVRRGVCVGSWSRVRE